jgi:hypothetical protein
MHKMPPPSPLPTLLPPPPTIMQPTPLTKTFSLATCACACAFASFCCLLAVALHLDNLEDAQHHHTRQAKGWAQFIESCRPHTYDDLGRVTYITCPVAQPATQVDSQGATP